MFDECNISMMHVQCTYDGIEHSYLVLKEFYKTYNTKTLPVWLRTAMCYPIAGHCLFRQWFDK